MLRFLGFLWLNMLIDVMLINKKSVDEQRILIDDLEQYSRRDPLRLNRNKI